MVLGDTPRRSEQGFSLVESLVAITVLGIIVTAMVGGMATSITMSGIHRHEASANTMMVSAAEVVKHLPYADCARGLNPPYSTAAIALPPGWSISIGVQYWEASPRPGFEATTCHDSDRFPMQLVTIFLTIPNTALTACPVYQDQVEPTPKSTSCVAIVKRKS